ncbi:hypothetical protein HY449_01710 [Candidatus Pacearchaeota archaeon]|nr:hypothetical protein [Candidatus Pacearchaeota archaeon]
MEYKHLTRDFTCALFAASIIFYSGCSLNKARSDRDSCAQYVNRLNEQMNREGRNPNYLFGGVDFSCSR